MIRLLKHTLKLKTMLTLFFLITLGFLGNVFRLPLFGGVDLIFGSIAILIISVTYGISYGAFAAIIANSYTYILWNHYYGILIFLFEAITVGFLVGKKNKSFLVSDILYWIFIGGPFVYVSYHIFLGLNNTQTLTIVLKDSVNGIFNSLIVSIIIVWTPLDKWIHGIKKVSLPSIRSIFLELLLIIVFITAFSFNYLNSLDEFNRSSSEVRSNLATEAIRAESIINTWHTSHVNALVTLAQHIEALDTRSDREIQPSLELLKGSIPEFVTLYYGDKNGKTISFAPKYNSNGESNLGLDFSDREYFQDVKTKLKPTVSKIFMGRGGVFTPIVSVSVPVITNNQFQGFVSGALDINRMCTLLSNNFNNEDTLIFLVDTNNKIVASNDSVFKPMDELTLRKANIKDLKEDTYYIQTMSGDNILNLEKWRNAMYVYKQDINDGQIDWTIIVAKPVMDYQRNLNAKYMRNFAFMLCLTALMGLLAFLLSRLVSKPIVTLAEVSKELPKFLDKQNKIIWPNSSILETNSLITSFKSMLKVINENFEEINNRNKTLDFIAKHDPLTGLPNRRCFIEGIDDLMQRAALDNKMLAIAYLDFDRFKRVNDTLGHNKGDKILKEITKRVQNCIDDNCILYRMAGDEFVLVFKDVYQSNNVVFSLSKIVDSLQQSYYLEELEIKMTASIGVALYPQDGVDSDTLLRNADIAMYHAKKGGRNNYMFYSSLTGLSSLNRLNLEYHLHNALITDEFSVYYQPKIDITSGKIIGAEALLRWNNSEYGPISPSDFIPLAEETGLIIPIGMWVLKTVINDMKAWEQKGYLNITVSVNISSIQLQSQDFLSNVLDILERQSIDGSFLEFEITESSIMQDVEFSIQVIDRIKESGIKISLDDFGTGFSSLNYIKKFDIDLLKIDASFVRDIYTDPSDAAIVRTIIGLAKNLELKVVAEGVETMEQFEFLKNEGCDIVQGYLFSRPMAASEFKKIL